MATDTGVLQATEPMPEIAREYFRRLARAKGGFATMPKEQRVLNGKLYAKSGWATRREKHGTTGQQHKPHSQWRKEHGYPLVSETICEL